MRRGQVAIYLLVVLAVILALAVMNLDVFITVREKNRVGNSGDAAALAAAREQGRLLNEIGRRNFAHLRAAVDGKLEQAEEYVMEQRRLALLGPLDALRDADSIAVENGAERREDFARLLHSHAETVRSVYANSLDSAGEPYPEPWPGAWGIYADALDAVAYNGIAAAPDNSEFHNAAGEHILTRKDFYQAVNGRDWCWFHFNAKGLLDSYGGWQSWGPLPASSGMPIDNCEVFPLHVRSRQCAMSDLFEPEELAELTKNYSETPVTAEELVASVVFTNRTETWFFLDSARWRQWYEISPSGDGGGFPVVGEVKPEYNVRGCAAVCRSIIGDSTWSAAAKPFGAIQGEDGLEDVTAKYHLVLPVFESVRLVPLDSVGGEDLQTADVEWVDHLRLHLPVYLSNGPAPLSRKCSYCAALHKFEQAQFRQTGSIWLRFHSDECRRGEAGGYSGAGGTSHGH